MRPVVLTIAGHDPSGGAGIAADLRVIEAMGCIGVSVITALTIQNTLGVESVHATDPDVLARTLANLLADIRPDAVKIGMLAGAAQVGVVAAALRSFKLTNVVLDTVFASTGGVPLLDDAGVAAIVRDLFPLCDVVTPNLDEAERLTGFRVRDKAAMVAAGRRILKLGAKGSVVKGGHLESDIVDVITWHPRSEPYAHPGYRVETNATHGTGCFLSTAIACGLAVGDSVSTAHGAAYDRLLKGLMNGVRIGSGQGYPGTRQIGGRYRDRRRYDERLSLLRGVYVLTGTSEQLGKTAEDCIIAALRGGARVVQLRSKNHTTRMVSAEASRLASTARAYDGLLIVNDDVAAVAATRADGVHLGPDDMAPRDARRVLGPAKLIGVSVNTVKEASAARLYASYFGVGPVFGTKSKHDAGDAIGVGRLIEIKKAFPHVPIVAIGGINASNIDQVRDSGVEAAAVISAVADADDMEAATRELVAIWNAGKGIAPAGV